MLPEVSSLIDELLADIQLECAAIDHAESGALDHAFEEGKFARRLRDLLPHKFPGGFRGLLEGRGLKKTQVYDCILLAKHEDSVRRAGHSSIRAALKALRAKPPKTKSGKSENIRPDVKVAPIDSTAVVKWFNHTAFRKERLEVLNRIDINADEFLEAIPSKLRHALMARLPTPPTKTALKKRRIDDAHADKQMFRDKKVALEAIAKSKEATASQKRAADADARRAGFHDVNAEPVPALS
jgi:hypothetical protein